MSRVHSEDVPCYRRGDGMTLKPCPFCGSNYVEFKTMVLHDMYGALISYDFCVVCECCDTSMFICEINDKSAITDDIRKQGREKWNKRVKE